VTGSGEQTEGIDCGPPGERSMKRLPRACELSQARGRAANARQKAARERETRGVRMDPARRRHGTIKQTPVKKIYTTNSQLYFDGCDMAGS